MLADALTRTEAEPATEPTPTSRRAELARRLQRGDLRIIEDVDGPLADTVDGARTVRQSAYQLVRERGPDGILDLPLNVGARDALRRIRERGNEVVVMTNRPEVCNELTETWLVMNDVPHDEYRGCVDGDKTRHDECDAVIDDEAEQVIQAAERGKFGILFNRPWTDAEEAREHPDVIVVDGWDELESLAAG